MVSIIVAYTEDMAIGYRNKLICRISEDMKRFKQLTTGNVVVMGRKTFESLPSGALPDRENAVVSTTLRSLAGATVFGSLEEAIAAYRDGGREVFIIGGGSIYAQAMGLADRIYATEISGASAAADTFFPPIDHDLWVVRHASELKTDSKSGLAYRFVDYCRASGQCK